MVSLIPKSTIEEIRNSINIVDVIGKDVDLKKKGKYFWGICPFVSENSPSFTVDEENQRYKCYSCGRSGNVFDYVSEKKGLSFPQAVIEVARNVGIKIDSKYTENTGGHFNENELKLIELNKQASEIFTHLLLNTDLSTNALKYLLEERHLNRETIADFQLGFLPSQWSLHDFFEEKKIPVETQLESGIISQYDDGSFHDVFSNRIMFPLKDSYGNIVGFSGRTLDKNNSAKYINSKETAVFKKSKLLYHFDVAKQAAKVSQKLLLLEGYLDVIAAHKAGIDYGIASMGTSLTKDQLQLISRNTPKLTIAYDGDSAGQSATWRAIEEIKNFPHLQLEIVTIPNQKDPDEYLQRNGPDALKKIFEEDSTSINDFAFEYLKKGRNLENVGNLSDYTNDLLNFLNEHPDPIANDLTLKKLSDQFGLSRSVLDQSLKRNDIDVSKRQVGQSSRQNDNPPLKNSRNRNPLIDQEAMIERKIIVSSIYHENVFHEIEKKAKFTFHDPKNQLYYFLIKGYRSKHPGTQSIGINLMKNMTASEKDQFNHLISDQIDFYSTDNLEAIDDYLWQLNRRIPFEKQIQQIKQQIQEAINLNQNDRIKELNVKLVKLMKERAGNKHD
ncbi:DNA primase [Oenococcus oeni]|uniref:DNA primase n=1 Tax=Oenococcus oeni TaxID=1247 RepID=UPI0008F8AC44|nr:DNA primase [Oenococcus oeni]MDV7686172.1 DNA primase [Oenococcus oeni]OIK56909.1 DNA primase [Oenococcus oeni]OIM63503.1 DNA primase [Oenococcus oeni]OLQ40426.1 DNA primase [Oenococcus oeni]SYW01536.1 DNA primase [Oenococcus oeni]